ncbi:MAG: phosphodiester glycosidase family protein [Mailhella sp.]|nr:phosphodiester glycosidase family protein [Mailhella sp.]
MDTARKTVFLLLFLMLLPATGLAVQEPATTLPGKEISWTSPEQGMDLAQLSYTIQKGESYARRVFIHVLRLSPDDFEFRLFSARWENSRALPIREWMENKELAAAINACMYQTDGITSTGYMRNGGNTNNAHVAKRYGSFFVSGPRMAGLPQAAVLDRSVDSWQKLLPLYDTVVQNFRLMGPDGEQLWPENGPRHAVAAVAQDKAGRILFLLCPEPVSVHDFVNGLNAHKSLGLHSAMYVEGGSDAALMFSSGGKSILRNGLSPTGYMLSSRGDDIPLPNILGVLRR